MDQRRKSNFLEDELMMGEEWGKICQNTFILGVWSCSRETGLWLILSRNGQKIKSGNFKLIVSIRLLIHFPTGFDVCICIPNCNTKFSSITKKTLPPDSIIYMSVRFYD